MRGSRAVDFPNNSRAYDGEVNGVRFWGYDQVVEIAFVIEAQALGTLAGDSKLDEPGCLEQFDQHVERIHQCAQKIYGVQGKSKHIFAFTLTAADLGA